MAALAALSGLLAFAPSASGDVSIGRADTDGAEVTPVLVNEAGPGAPGDLAVSDDHLYWLVGDAIARADLDGSDVDLGFITGLRSATGLTAGGGYLFWGGPSIGRARLDGTGVEPSFMAPAGGAADVAAGARYLYWTSEVGIGRANLDGTGADPAFIETGVREMTPAAPVRIDAPRHLAVNGTRVFWVYDKVELAALRIAMGRANLDGSGAEYPIISGAPYPHPGVYRSLGADESRVFFVSSSWSPDHFDGEISSLDANFAAGSATGCCSPSWPSIDDPFSTETLTGGVAVDRGHVYWAHAADRELHCFWDPLRTNQRQRGRRIRFKVWLEDCERITVRASGKVRIGPKRYRLKPRAVVVGPSFGVRDPARFALRPRRKHRHRILAALEHDRPAYARMRLRISDASGNSRVTTYRVRLVRRRGDRHRSRARLSDETHGSLRSHGV